jgi:hypothetical protein
VKLAIPGVVLKEERASAAGAVEGVLVQGGQDLALPDFPGQEP